MELIGEIRMWSHDLAETALIRKIHVDKDKDDNDNDDDNESYDERRKMKTASKSF